MGWLLDGWGSCTWREIGAKWPVESAAYDALDGRCNGVLTDCADLCRSGIGT